MSSTERKNSPNSVFARELAESGHEVLKYDPQYVGSGSDRIVFRTEGHPNVIVKVSQNMLRQAINWHIDNQTVEPGDVLHDPEAQNMLSAIEVSYRADHRQLREFFTDSQILKSRMTKLKVPVLPIMLQTYGINSDSNFIPKEVYVIAEVQEAIQEIIDETAISLTSVSTPMSHEVYAKRMAQALFQPNEVSNDESVCDVFDPSKSVGLQEILRNKSETKEAITDFIKRACAYSQNTGRNLDTMGRHNIVLRKQDEGWNFVLIDATILTTKTPWMTRVQSHFSSYVQNPEQFDLHRDNQEPLRDICLVAEYVLFINTLAQIFDVEERLDMYTGYTNEEVQRLTVLLQECHIAWEERRMRMKNKKI